jgi:hypothetical protein
MGEWALKTLAALVSLMGVVGCGGGPQAAAPRGLGAPLPAPRVAVGELDVHLLLADLPQRATRLGAGQVAIVASSELVEGERIGAFVEVPHDKCLLAYARASSSVDDIDVSAFADEGNPIAADEAPDARPTILFCPPHPDRVYVAVHDASGEGLVALAAQLVPPDRATEIAHSMGARGVIGPGTRPADAWPGLDDHVRVHREGLGGKWEEFRKVAVSVDARVPSYVAFPLEADQCTDAVIVPDEDVAVLEVEAVDEAGHVVARAREGSRDKTLTVCSPLAVSGSLSIRPHVGQGLVAIVLARGKGDTARDLSLKPDIAWSASTLPLESTRAARNAELAKLGYAGPSAAPTGVLVIARRTSVPIDVAGPQGSCTRIDVIGGAPLALLSGTVWDDAGGLVTSGEGAASVTLFACKHGAARLDLEARGRPGPFAVLVRPEKWQNAFFLAHPIAAARMLARAAAGPSFVLEGVASTVRTVSLDATRLVTFDETVGPGKCLRVAAGGEGPGTGIDLRIFDRNGPDELDRSHAEHAVAVRACASETGPRTFRVELRATSGRLDVVVGERIAG